MSIWEDVNNLIDHYNSDDCEPLHTPEDRSRYAYHLLESFEQFIKGVNKKSELDLTFSSDCFKALKAVADDYLSGSISAEIAIDKARGFRSEANAYFKHNGFDASIEEGRYNLESDEHKTFIDGLNEGLQCALDKFSKSSAEPISPEERAEMDKRLEDLLKDKK